MSVVDLLRSARISPVLINAISFLDSHIGSMMQNMPLIPTQMLSACVVNHTRSSTVWAAHQSLR